MKKILKLTLACLLYFTTSAYCQDDICGTESIDYDELAQYVAVSKNDVSDCMVLNVKFHIIKLVDGYFEFQIEGDEYYQDQEVVDIVMNNLANAFEPHGISFREIEPLSSVVANDDYLWNTNTSLSNALNVTMNHEDIEVASNAINIFLKGENSVPDGGTSMPYWYSSYGSTMGIYLSGGTVGESIALSNIVVHEMGHILGLRHVYSNTAGFENLDNGGAYDYGEPYVFESVDESGVPTNNIGCQNISFSPEGSECELHGDYVCDTYVVPFIHSSEINSDGDWVISDATDATRIRKYKPHCDGSNFDASLESEYDIFTPQTDNFMGYYGSSNMSSFTPGQVDRMYTALVNVEELQGIKFNPDIESYFGFEYDISAICNGGELTFSYTQNTDESSILWYVSGESTPIGSGTNLVLPELLVSTDFEVVITLNDCEYVHNFTVSTADDIIFLDNSITTIETCPNTLIELGSDPVLGVEYSWLVTYDGIPEPILVSDNSFVSFEALEDDFLIELFVNGDYCGEDAARQKESYHIDVIDESEFSNLIINMPEEIEISCPEEITFGPDDLPDGATYSFLINGELVENPTLPLSIEVSESFVCDLIVVSECGATYSYSTNIVYEYSDVNLFEEDELYLCNVGQVYELSSSLLGDFTYEWSSTSNDIELDVNLKKGESSIFPYHDNQQVSLNIYNNECSSPIISDDIDVYIYENLSSDYQIQTTGGNCLGEEIYMSVPLFSGADYFWSSTNSEFQAPPTSKAFVSDYIPEYLEVVSVTVELEQCNVQLEAAVEFNNIIDEIIDVELDEIINICNVGDNLIGPNPVDGYSYSWAISDIENLTTSYQFETPIQMPEDGNYQINLMVDGPTCSNVASAQIGVYENEYHFPTRTISSDEIWTPSNLPENQNVLAAPGVIRIENSLTISSGNTLIIEPGVRVEMGEEAMVIVEQGATLKLNGGTITNACAPWKGITVFGNSELSQTSTNQGRLIMNNQSEISGAHVGVCLMGKDSDGSFIWGTQGGILKAHNSKFVNCRKAIEFMSYQPTNSNNQPVENISYVKNCEFLFDQTVNTLYNGSSDLTGISLYKVDGVDILGCNFILDLPIEGEPFKKYDGKAISSIDASYTIDANGSFNEYPPSDRSYFSGFEYGVLVDNTDDIASVKIDRSDFDNNRVGVLLRNSDYSSVLRNTFNVPVVASNQTEKITSVGLHLEESTGYHVEDNSFLGTGFLTNSTSGIVVKNSGSAYNLIYRNSFDHLGYGCGVYGYNSVPSYMLSVHGYTGLNFKCNNFGRSSSSYNPTNLLDNKNDLYLYSDASIDATQGSFNSPAGNLFSDNPINSYDGNISNNNIDFGILNYYFDNVTGANPIHHNTDGVQANDISGYGYVVQECLPNISEIGYGSLDFGLIDEIDIVKEDLDILVDNYKEILNGGIKPEIMAVLLDDFASSSDIHAKLAEGSPYLSDDVLIAAISRELPMNQYDLFHILTWNGKLSRKVLSVFNEVQPLTPYLRDILLSMDGSSQRYLLEMQIRAKEISLGELTAKYIHAALFDESVENPFELISEVITQNNTPEVLHSAVAVALKLNNIQQAQELLDTYLLDNSNASMELTQIQIDLKSEGLDWFSLSDNQKLTIQNIALDENSFEHNKAKAVLSIIEGDENPEYAMPIAYLADMRLAQNIDDESTPRSIMSISPNPSDKEVYVTYELPQQYNSAFLEIKNILGQSIVAHNLSNSPYIHRFSCEEFKSGVYLVSLVVDGEFIETQKLNVITK